MGRPELKAKESGSFLKKRTKKLSGFQKMMAAQSVDCAAYDTGRQRGGGCASALVLTNTYIHVAKLQLSNSDFTKLCYF